MKPKQTSEPDIVERLRGYNPPDRTIDEQRQIAVDIQEAAAEIERLRALPSRSDVLEEAARVAEVANIHDDGGWVCSEARDQMCVKIAAAIRALKDTDNG